MLLLGLVQATATMAQTTFHREYTKEHPLVYEDAWDLWPYVFLDDEGKPSGFNVEMLKIIFEELKIPYVIQLKPTALALEDLRSGKADLMLGMVANFHDDYTTHYGRNTIHLFTHSVAHPASKASTIHETEDLAHNQVIVHEGSFSHHLMQDHGWGDNAIAHGDMDKAIQMVSAENEGQVLWNTMSLKWLIHKYHADNLKLSPVNMPSGDYRFMANDEQLLQRLDNAYSQLKASDRLHPLEHRWFFPEAQVQTSTPRWVWWLIISIGSVTLILIIASIVTKLREQKATRQGRRRTAQLALILENSHLKIWTYDIRRDSFTWYGDSAIEKKTYSRQEFSRRYRPDDFTHLMDCLGKIASQEETKMRLEATVADGPNGEERIYIINLAVLRRRKDKPAVIIGTKLDVTDDYAKMKEDNELMMRYRAVFNTAMVDMIYYNSQGYIENMNMRAQSSFNMKLEDVLKEHVNIYDILPPENFAIENLTSEDYFYSTLFLDYAKEKELQSRKRQGKLVYELQLVPVFNQFHKMLGIYGTGREITEMVENYRKAKQNVQQLRKTMQEVADHVDNINYALQVGGVRMVSYSPQSHMLTIYHRMHEAQYTLTQQRCIQLTNQDSLNQVMRLFRAMDRKANAQQSCDIPTRLRLPGGRFLSMQVQLFPQLDDSGRVMAYSGICRDTTEMKHTEQLLQLETTKAQEVEMVKNKFLHNMCYEIRTPLNTVVGFAEMFENDHSYEDEEKYIEEIKKNSSYLLDLINDILFLSRLDAHMVEINTEFTDFAKTFEAHFHMGLGTNRKEGVNYVAENKYDKLIVKIDDANVGRILQQVIQNATKLTTHGTVRARYEYIGGKLIIAVDDTGPGINPKKLEHIFERFNTPGNNDHGTGLGLPICKELVTQLGGTIDINSEVGKGTTVWITLPCEASEIEHKVF